MIVSTTLIALAIRLAGFIGTTACTRARPEWCSTSSVAVLTALSSAFGDPTPNLSVFDVGAITPLDAQNAPARSLWDGAVDLRQLHQRGKRSGYEWGNIG
jgi:hypothetical protein